MRFAFFAAIVVSASSACQSRGEPDIHLTRGLFIERVTGGGRELARTDAVAHAVVTGAFVTPEEGGIITMPGGEPRTWSFKDAGKDGRFAPEMGRGGYSYFEVQSDADRPMVLEAVGHAMVYMDGEPRMGDPYGAGYVGVPVVLRKGSSRFLFSMAGRGGFSARLRAPRAPVEIEARDVTAPDLLEGDERTVSLGLKLRNTTRERAAVLLEAACEGQWDWRMVRDSDAIPPLSTLRVAARLPAAIMPKGQGVAIRLRVSLLSGDRDDAKEKKYDEATITLRVRSKHQSRKEMYNSLTDGSVQYYAAVPPSDQSEGSRHGLVLSLHGADVEATSQADSYSPKPDLWIVCPTNRHRYGFDWESWGREDALAVLKVAMSRFRPDPARVYVTGHSMGGHGTWQLASLFPGKFAAAAPSAGWISFETYSDRARKREANPMSEMLQRGAATSDTLSMLPNLAASPIFILHGDADDNVPVGEARKMAEKLGGFHMDWRIHEEKGAGHWWDHGEFGPMPGAACVDFPPIFEMFARARLPDPDWYGPIDFTTVNPAVSGSCHWAEVSAQRERLRPSRLRAELLTHAATGEIEVTASTINIQSFTLRLPRGRAIIASIDGRTLKFKSPDVSDEGVDEASRESTALVCFALDEQAGWSIAETLPGPQVPPGSFVDAYNGFLLVYGTSGTPEENAQSFAKARFDAEQWSYRGNGRAVAMSDREFLASDRLSDPSVLYGNSDVNGAWKKVLPDSEIQVTRGKVRIGTRMFENRSLGVLAIQKGKTGSAVGIIAGTDVVGARALDRLPIFVSGVGVPEVVVVEPAVLKDGKGGIVGAGMLGSDWSVGKGEWVWR